MPTRWYFLSYLTTLLFHASISKDGFSKNATEALIPEIPMSMLETLTEPVADVEGVEIYFETGKSQLGEAAMRALDLLSERFRDLRLYLLIEAHTDGSGSADLNMKLSRKRGIEVKSYLERRGTLRPQQIIVRAYGKTFSHIENHLPAEKQRRVRLTTLRQISDKISKAEYLKEFRQRGIEFGLLQNGRESDEQARLTSESRTTTPGPNPVTSGPTFEVGVTYRLCALDCSVMRRGNFSGIRIGGGLKSFVMGLDSNLVFSRDGGQRALSNGSIETQVRTRIDLELLSEKHTGSLGETALFASVGMVSNRKNGHISSDLHLFSDVATTNASLQSRARSGPAASLGLHHIVFIPMSPIMPTFRGYFDFDQNQTSVGASLGIDFRL